jgi:hypothetical protein
VGREVSLAFLVVSSSAAERRDACSSRETICPSGPGGRFHSKAATDASDCGDSGSCSCFPLSPSPITERSLHSVECKSKSDCDKCDGEAVLYLGTVCGNGKLPGDNDEIEGEKELGTMGEINDNLANEVDGDGV